MTDADKFVEAFVETIQRDYVSMGASVGAVEQIVAELRSLVRIVQEEAEDTSGDQAAWLIEDLRPPQPMYAAVNEWGMWYGEWDASNPAVVRFANKASAEGVMRAVRRRDDGYAPSGFHHLQEAREHMWVKP